MTPSPRDRTFSLAHHALRAPLTNLCSYAQIIQDLPIDPAQRDRALAALRCGAEEALLLLDRWFEAMRAMALFPVAPCHPRPGKPFSLHSLIREAVRSRERLALQRGLRIGICQESDEGPWMWIDREIVEASITCLLDAARLQLPHGSALNIDCTDRIGIATVRLTRGEGGAPFEPAVHCDQIDEAIALDRGLGVRFHLALAAHFAALAEGSLLQSREAACLQFPARSTG